MAALEEPPERAVLQGKAQFGRFMRPFRDLNLMDAEIGVPGLFGLRRFRLKEWVHLAMIHQEWYLSLALVDLKFLAASWLHVFDRRTGKAFEHARKLPPGRFQAPANVWDHSGRFEARGYRLSVRHYLERQVHRFEIQVKGNRDLPTVAGSLELHEDPAQTQPLVALLPLGPNRPMFTHKSAGSASGVLNIGGEKVELTPARTVALLDYHKAFYPRNTFWRWATFAVLDAGGDILGVNLTHNVILDDTRFNENCIWHGNCISAVGAARFDIPNDPRQPWVIRTQDGAVHLRFVPDGMRRERVNFGLIRSAFDQPYGMYSGVLRDSEGRTHDVEKAFGLAENHTARW